MKHLPYLLILIALSSCGGVEPNNETSNYELESSDISIAGLPNGSRIFLDRAGDTLFGGEKFYNVSQFMQGYSYVSKEINGEIKNGVINTRGEKIVPITFDEKIVSFNNGYFQLESEDKRYGYVDTLGNLVIKPIYKAVRIITNNQVTIQNTDNKWGVISLDGDVIVPEIYDWIGGWRDELAAVKLEGKYGFINNNGEIVIPLDYSFATDFEQGVTICKLNDKYGLVDVKGSVVSDFIYDEYKIIVDNNSNDYLEDYQTNERFSMKEGYIILRMGDKWGYINTKGETVIPFEYDSIGVPDFGSDKVSVVKSGRNGIYNLTENKVNWLD